MTMHVIEIYIVGIQTLTFKRLRDPSMAARKPVGLLHTSFSDELGAQENIKPLNASFRAITRLVNPTER